MLLLDTSVLIRGTGVDHEDRAAARALIDLSDDHPIRTTVDVMQEFLHVRSRRFGRVVAAGMTRGLTEALRPFPAPAEALPTAIDLFEQHASLNASDALLLASAAYVGAAAVITDDRGFLVQDAIRVVMLSDDPGIAEVLASLA